MLNRRNALFLFAAATLAPTAVLAQASMPGEAQILRRLEAGPRERVRQQDRVTIDQFKRRSAPPRSVRRYSGDQLRNRLGRHRTLAVPKS